MNKINKNLLIQATFYYLSLLVVMWSILFINIYFFNGGDNYKWNGKSGDFIMGMFFSFPIITSYSIGNYFSLLLFHNWILDLTKFKIFMLETIITIVFVVISTKTEIFNDSFIDRNGILFLIASGVVNICIIGLFVASIIIFAYKIITNGLTSLKIKSREKNKCR